MLSGSVFVNSRSIPSAPTRTKHRRPSLIISAAKRSDPRKGTVTPNAPLCASHIARARSVQAARSRAPLGLGDDGKPRQQDDAAGERRDRRRGDRDLRTHALADKANLGTAIGASPMNDSVYMLITRPRSSSDTNNWSIVLLRRHVVEQPRAD